MELFLISFLVFGLAFLGMAVGVLFGRRPFKGSCGGPDCLDGADARCGICFARPPGPGRVREGS